MASPSTPKMVSILCYYCQHHINPIFSLAGPSTQPSSALSSQKLRRRKAKNGCLRIPKAGISSTLCTESTSRYIYIYTYNICVVRGVFVTMMMSFICSCRINNQNFVGEGEYVKVHMFMVFMFMLRFLCFIFM